MFSRFPVRMILLCLVAILIVSGLIFYFHKKAVQVNTSGESSTTIEVTDYTPLVEPIPPKPTLTPAPIPQNLSPNFSEIVYSAF